MNAPAGHLRLRGRIELGDYPVDAAWSPDGSAVVVACGAGTIALVTIGPALRAEPIGAHAGGALAVTWQKAGNLFASSGQDGAVLLWDARTLQSRAIHSGTQWCEHLAFANDGRTLAVALGRSLQLLDAGGALRHRFEPHAGVIAALSWRPKSNEIAAAGNGGARIHRGCLL